MSLENQWRLCLGILGFVVVVAATWLALQWMWAA